MLDGFTGKDTKSINQGNRGRTGSKVGHQKEGSKAGQARKTKRKEAAGENKTGAREDAAD